MVCPILCSKAGGLQRSQGRSARKRAARTARNPQTGEIIKLEATKVPAFRAGKGLKDTIAGVKKP